MNTGASDGPSGKPVSLGVKVLVVVICTLLSIIVALVGGYAAGILFTEPVTGPTLADLIVCPAASTSNASA